MEGDWEETKKDLRPNTKVSNLVFISIRTSVAFLNKFYESLNIFVK